MWFHTRLWLLCAIPSHYSHILPHQAMIEQYSCDRQFATLADIYFYHTSAGERFKDAALGLLLLRLAYGAWGLVLPRSINHYCHCPGVKNSTPGIQSD